MTVSLTYLRGLEIRLLIPIQGGSLVVCDIPVTLGST